MESDGPYKLSHDESIALNHYMHPRRAQLSVMCYHVFRIRSNRP